MGSVFEGSFEVVEDSSSYPDAGGPIVIPTITGSAWVTSEASLILADSDPYRAGIQL